MLMGYETYILDILYMESVKDYLKIYTTGTVITAKYRISEMENDIASKGFLRIHRSYIINLKQITAFTAAEIEIGRVQLPIGESYKAYIDKALMRK